MCQRTLKKPSTMKIAVEHGYKNECCIKFHKDLHSFSQFTCIYLCSCDKERVFSKFNKFHERYPDNVLHVIDILEKEFENAFNPKVDAIF